jgi:hypothetical protein
MKKKTTKTYVCIMGFKIMRRKKKAHKIGKRNVRVKFRICFLNKYILESVLDLFYFSVNKLYNFTFLKTL